MDKKVLDKMTTTWQNWRYPPEKPKLKSKKKKKILKESSPGYDNREFGDPLPTLADTAKAYADKDNLNEGNRLVDLKRAKSFLEMAQKSINYVNKKVPLIKLNDALRYIDQAIDAVDSVREN